MSKSNRKHTTTTTTTMTTTQQVKTAGYLSVNK